MISVLRLSGQRTRGSDRRSAPSLASKDSQMLPSRSMPTPCLEPPRSPQGFKVVSPRSSQGRRSSPQPTGPRLRHALSTITVSSPRARARAQRLCFRPCRNARVASPSNSDGSSQLTSPNTTLPWKCPRFGPVGYPTVARAAPRQISCRQISYLTPSSTNTAAVGWPERHQHHATRVCPTTLHRSPPAHVPVARTSLMANPRTLSLAAPGRFVSQPTVVTM